MDWPLALFGLASFCFWLGVTWLLPWLGFLIWLLAWLGLVCLGFWLDFTFGFAWL